MKTFNTVMKVLAALATVAGAVYLVATYGDKLVSWARKLLKSCPCRNGECCCTEEDIADEEAAVEEADVVVAVDSQEETEEVSAEEAAPVAEEADFEG